MSIIMTRHIEVRTRSAPMSLHFDDVDPVAECHVGDCQWHAHGDALIDAATLWITHLTQVHQNDWE